MRHNVTTPGGFFIGLGGIAAFCAASLGVSWWVTHSGPTDDLMEARLATGLAVPKDLPAADAAKKKAELDTVFQTYGYANSDVKLTLDELRGIVRVREAAKASKAGTGALNALPTWKDKAKGEVTMPIQFAIVATAKELASRKPKPSEVKVDIIPADPANPRSLPNAGGGGVQTVTFPAPQPAVPAEAKPAAPAPEAPKTSAITATPAVAATAHIRPPLLNWSESQK